MYPYISTDDFGNEFLVEGEITSLIGDRKYSVRDFNDFTNIIEKYENEISRKIKSDLSNDGELIRLLLANEYLDESENILSTALKANVSFFPFQMRPLLKFYTMAEKRLLIADETGLGKTIEAGMIIAETVASNPNCTIIILSPASVISKWIHELRRKFGIRAFPGNLKDFDGKKIPRGVFVISHGSMKEKEFVKIKEKSIKLLVIDEIHLFIGRKNQQKRRSRAICLSKSAEGVVGLSATPIQLEVNDLQKILELISPGEHSIDSFSEQIKIQMAINKIIIAKDKMETPDRESLNFLEEKIGINPIFSIEDLSKSIEKEQWEKYRYYLQSIGPIGKRITRARAKDPDINLAKKRIIFDHLIDMEEYKEIITEIDSGISQINGRFSNRQQLASCPSAAIRILSKIIDDENLNDGTDTEGENLSNNSIEINKIKSLIPITEAIMPNLGPKIEKLIEIINQLSIRNDVSKVVIFTHWKPTLIHTSKILQNNLEHSVHKINPLDNYQLIEKKIERFRSEEEFSILLVTDKMGIGIDLEMANVCINMDLPWNPAVLQQRIGRLDRIIQKSDFIEIHNLILKDSLEERIKQVLEERIGHFKKIIGDMEPIIQDEEEEIIIPNSENEIYREIGHIRKEMDINLIAESEIILRVIDTSFDNNIRNMRDKLHPLHSIRYLLITNAMERMGAEARWEEEEGAIYLKMNEKLRKGLMDSKNFFPWGPEEVYAAFESMNSKNEIMITIKGKKSILGPLNPFQKACTKLLFNLEGFEITAQDISNNYYLLGNSKDDVRWKYGGSEQQPCDVKKLIKEIEVGEKKFHWFFTNRSGLRQVYVEMK